MINRYDISEGERAFLEDKFVHVACDYRCEGIWDRNHVSFNHDAFPVSDTLKARLMAWQAVSDKYWDLEVAADDKGETLNLDWESFNRTGHQIAVDIKRELPDWTVFYFDEYRSRNRHSQIGFRKPNYWYEITADMV